MKKWIAAFRLKTLPLALGAIILGSWVNDFSFDFEIFLFASITAILLQILSNLANDYGDYIKGTDRHRKDRQLAEGTISPRSMIVAIILFSLGSLLSGIYLLNLSFGDNWDLWIRFLLIGMLSIAAAISYTVGKRAYGYMGLGDVFVFIFFGLVGVLGTSYLFKQEIWTSTWLLAIGYGCLCVGVLNVNNIRDLDKDVLTNKITIASKLGLQGSIIYQTLLIITAFLTFSFYHLIENYYSLSPLLILILGFVHIQKLKEAETETDYNNQLRFLSIGSLGIVLLFVIRLFF
ncbi:MAG: 1,4-dihydroxy-2-naphthoate octaprenyltransferase [Bacteroidia bacterium]|jgi:1,4-dihydroxy-2-naphthoate octaprenyltransferase|nr:1,4-dihydroxy-2-naphthoate octaprenyltransferase [Bacteroidia bacterium]